MADNDNNFFIIILTTRKNSKSETLNSQNFLEFFSLVQLKRSPFSSNELEFKKL